MLFAIGALTTGSGLMLIVGVFMHQRLNQSEGPQAHEGPDSQAFTNLFHDVVIGSDAKTRTELLLPATVSKLETLQLLGLVDEANFEVALSHPLAACALVETIEEVCAQPLEQDPKLSHFYQEWHERTYEKMLMLSLGQLAEIEPGVEIEADPDLHRLVDLVEADKATPFEAAEALMSPASRRDLIKKVKREA